MAQSLQSCNQIGSLCSSSATGTTNTITINTITPATNNIDTSNSKTINTPSNNTINTTCISSTINTTGTSSSSSSYVWTEEDTAELIAWRIRNGALFTGRRNAAQRGFEEFVRLRGLSGKIDPVKVKRKWENLKQKYKELNTPGVRTEGAETPGASWKWYGAMDEALRLLTPYKNRPVLIDSSGQKLALKSPPNCPEKSPESGILVKRRKEPEWHAILKGMLEKEEEKEKVSLEREERREREALAREERKERECLEREEKRERKRVEREERWEREHREWEERREMENREREERREREWIERQERWERERREWEEKREMENREREQRRDKENREREERWQKESQARDDKLLEVLKLLMEKK